MAIPLNVILQPFRSDDNPILSLAGKPKIFIIQACRGPARDRGIELATTVHHDAVPAADLSRKTVQFKRYPAVCDWLEAHSTTAGFCSYRCTTRGSHFIRIFCEVMEHNEKTGELCFLSILREVQSRMAFEFRSRDSENRELDGMKQVPSIESTLIKRLELHKPKRFEVFENKSERREE